MKFLKSVFLFQVIFLSSCGMARIELSENLLCNNENKEISFKLDEKKNEIVVTQDGKDFLISNCEKIGKKDSFVYAFFNLVPDKSEQILLCYCDNNNTKYEYVSFNPETSYFFEDDLVCIVNKKNPNLYPLPPLYEIKITVMDFKNNFRNEQFYQCRNWYSMNTERLQDFYYQEPHFRKFDNFKGGVKEIDKKFEKYLKNGNVYSCIWEQAHFPSFIYYYCEETHDVFVTNSYPDSNNSLAYRLPQEEFIPNKEQKVLLKQSHPTTVDIVCSEKKGSSEITVLQNGDDLSDFNSYVVNINNGKEDKTIMLASIFKYQDELISIKNASGMENKACFIITTKEFAYDMYIDLFSFETDVYLRASSFPDNVRYFE